MVRSDCISQHIKYIGVCIQSGVYTYDDEDQSMFISEKHCFTDLLAGLAACPCGMTRSVVQVMNVLAANCNVRSFSLNIAFHRKVMLYGPFFTAAAVSIKSD